MKAQGLDPSHGGREGGLSDEKSLVGRREQNLVAARGKVFISRKFSEAKQYADGDEGRIVMLIVPSEFLGDLQVDPDSMTGLVGTDYLKGTILDSGYPNWWGSTYLMKEINDKDAKTNFFTLWTVLMKKNLIKP